MSGTPILAGIIALSLAIAAGFTTYTLLDGTRDVARLIWRRLAYRRRSLLVLIQGQPPADPAAEPSSGGGRFIRAGGRLIPAALGLTLVIYADVGLRAPVIGLGLGACGLALSWYLGLRTRQVERSALSDQVRGLVEEVQSLYGVLAMPFTCLEQAAATVPQPLRSLVERAVQGYRMHTDAARSLADLVTASGGNSYVAHLAYILTQAARAGQDDVMAALDSLETRLRDRERLRHRAQVVLRMVSITIRTLQGALVAALATALFVPLFSEFFCASLGRQILYVLVLVGALLSSLYFDYESHHLQEGLS